MILSGPKAWRGSTKEARILPHFLHSAGGEHQCQLSVPGLTYLYLEAIRVLTRHRRGKRIMKPHICGKEPEIDRRVGRIRLFVALTMAAFGALRVRKCWLVVGGVVCGSKGRRSAGGVAFVQGFEALP